MAMYDEEPKRYVSITPLLKRLWPSPASAHVTADEVALAVSHILKNELSPVQTGALLTALHFTAWDRRADVIARCAMAMRDVAAPVDIAAIHRVTKRRGLGKGNYQGGLCDIVGTGGDDHSTFNVSTTASIIASSDLLVAKHGNRASTSMSGSADVLASMYPLAPKLQHVTPETIAQVYEKSNYAFLYGPVFHPGMKHVAAVRRELGWRTIFNLLGPLANPVDDAIEARIVGVARRDLGLVFAEALRMSGARKAMVVCGAENLDEISCAGKTFCWRLVEMPTTTTTTETAAESESSTTIEIESLILSPADFGLPTHPLSTVSSGLSAVENAALLKKLLQNGLAPDDPVLHFVLMNVAALFEVAGICRGDDDDDGDDQNVIVEEGPGRGRWKEGVRRARLAIETGEVWRSWSRFVEISNG